MKRVVLLFIVILFTMPVFAQAPQSWNAGQIYQAIKKLNVLGSVLYIAAHPDDENTRLITWLANEQRYRTGYLSLTRGDGGQNLIGDEQGIDLGLIRTQELLAARRIDGGEQFFSRAYDFGFSKSPEEALAKWGHDKILSDVVWVIRNFKPDIIITRFPTTGEGGHGHHTASAILANEAFTAAADPAKFPEQLKYVQPWQTKRVLWNTFNFGGTNTTDPSQFKVDVGGYNALLGKSYGEIAAQSRSQHKSQGFGVAATRGQAMEFFKTTAGTAPQLSLLDDVNTGWNRIGAAGNKIGTAISAIDKTFNTADPSASIPALVAVYKSLQQLPESYWTRQKMNELRQIIIQCAGLYFDAYTAQPVAVQKDSIKVDLLINSRLAEGVVLKKWGIDEDQTTMDIRLEKNRNQSFGRTISIPLTKEITQPYWLKEKMDEGSFHVSNQQLIGMADVEPAYNATVTIAINGVEFDFSQPVRYRAVDPVKGEVYQPLYIIPGATISVSPGLLVFNKNTRQHKMVHVYLHSNKMLSDTITVSGRGAGLDTVITAPLQLAKGQTKAYELKTENYPGQPERGTLFAYANQKIRTDTAAYYLAMRGINYDHIPAIKYFYPDQSIVLNIDIKTAGKKIGYIMGAGDKVPEALKQMGYEVTLLADANLGVVNLAQFDAIITGVRAYNTNEWMNNYYEKLMEYVKQGGNLIVQYNTSNNIGPVRAKIGPYPFEISRERVTDENARVTMLDPDHAVFNYPNKITDKDFEGWVQERSIYHASGWDTALKPLIAMKDFGQDIVNGSLVTGKYGKGYFTYTGLVFFRELPAGVPGAYRLIANLIALNAQH